MLSKQTFDNRS